MSRPSFIPFWGVVNIEKHVPLALVIDIIIEQGTDTGLFAFPFIKSKGQLESAENGLKLMILRPSQSVLLQKRICCI